MRKFYSLSILMIMFLCGCASFETMRKDADAGDEIAQVLVGIKYFYGDKEVAMLQYDDARRYFEKAAKRENPLACYYLGEIYEKGLGQVEVDNDAAKVYYSRAAENLKSLPSVLRKHSYLAAAKMYDCNRGFARSESKAKFYYERAFDTDAAGSGSHIAEFLNRTRGQLSAAELYHILEDAIDNNEPQAKFMYAQSILKNNPDTAKKLIRQAADANYPPAIIADAELSGSKIFVRSANEKAAVLGYAPAFYELALLESNEEKRCELLKKSADRGHLPAIQALGDYYESNKEWNRATIYHYMAEKLGRGKASPALTRLSREVGLVLPVESIWQNKIAADIAQIGTNVEYFIRGYRAGIAKIRENYQRYLQDAPERSYINLDYVKLFNSNMPMAMAGDIFRIYYDSVHGNVGQDFYLNYAIAAGYAGQGEVQFRAAEKINLKRSQTGKWYWAKILLKANGLALMGSSSDAYELLFANYRGKISSENVDFIVNFVNGNCNMLLKDIRKLSAALSIPEEKFVAYKALKKQDFYDLEKRSDTNLISVPEEPVI